MMVLTSSCIRTRLKRSIYNSRYYRSWNQHDGVNKFMYDNHHHYGTLVSHGSSLNQHVNNNNHKSMDCNHHHHYGSLNGFQHSSGVRLLLYGNYDYYSRRQSYHTRQTCDSHHPSVEALKYAFDASSHTICQVASGGTSGAVAMIRVSGELAGLCFTRMTGEASTPRQRYAQLCTLYNPCVQPPNTEIIDSKVLSLWFAAPHSFTGEDVLEFHVHGSSYVIHRVLRVLCDLHPDIRLAERGEFTRRAFLNGKMTLTQVEGLADLLNTTTEHQHRQAIRQLHEEQSVFIEWRNELIRTLSQVEAVLDFSGDEYDVMESRIVPTMVESSSTLLHHIENALNDSRRGELIREGVHVAIVGEPNVGKSSLLNALTKRDVAIVSDEAGTTRDALSVELSLGGFHVTLCDTAGIRDTDAVGKIEREGIRRSLVKLEEADIVVCVVDASQYQLVPDSPPSVMEERPDAIVVANKCDLIERVLDDNMLRMSCVSGEGIDTFTNLLCERVEELIGCDGGEDYNSPVVTRERHRSLLLQCCEHLRAFLSAVETDMLIAAEELRLCVRFIGKITGHVDVDDVLDALFKDFCIGK